MRCDRIKVLLNLEWNVLSQKFHGIYHAANIKAQLVVLDDAEELTVSFFEEEFAFLLKDANIYITLFYVLVTQLHDVDG